MALVQNLAEEREKKNGHRVTFRSQVTGDSTGWESFDARIVQYVVMLLVRTCLRARDHLNAWTSFVVGGTLVRQFNYTQFSSTSIVPRTHRLTP